MAQTLLPFDAAEPQQAAGPAAAERVFLGWDARPLERAAGWLLQRFGSDQGALVVALPSSRAAARLRELLARRAPPDWTPPRLVTQGELSDELVRLERPAAERLARTLAWDRALERLRPEDLACLVRRGAGGLEVRERLRLSETVRTLHAELAQEGQDFGSLARGAELETEAARWRVLAEAQASYRELLGGVGLADPHEGRWQAIEAGRVDRERRVVLVGVADLNHLLARLLEEVRAQVSVLVVAPASEARSFDGFGRLRTAAWRERDLPLPLERWFVCEKPIDQAEVVGEVLAVWDGRHAASEIVIGVPDVEVVPYLERRLRAAGARARSAAGTPVERTRPARLLRAVVRYLSRGGYTDLAELARDPDLVPVLWQGEDAASRLDAYQREHLPRSGRGEWVADEELAPAVRAFHGKLEERLGELAASAERPLADWAAPIRDFLLAVFEGELSPEVEEQRVLSKALEDIGTVLGELEALPGALAGAPVAAHVALELLLRSLRGGSIPAAPRAAGETVVELLGWLDLPLDDAPALIVTGFNEGRVPQSIGGHAFLPDGARRKLGLPCDEDRLARDAYAATVLLHARAELVFVTGRRSVEGDPLVPSRLAFHRPAGEVPARVRRFLPSEEEEERFAEGDAREVDGHARPRAEHWPPIEALSVSSFRAYLDSPYLFFLERVLRLQSLDDRARELDPLHFGGLVHEVLQRFGEGPARDSAQAREIEECLVALVGELVRARYGDDPQPAVALQAEQLKHRLRRFAREQAARRAAGWRIHLVEWVVPEDVGLLEVDGRPLRITGRIDRIDLHDDGRWAILDYKTGENQRGPEKTHRPQGSWVDLQLPLYRYLATRGVGLPGEPALGYGTLGRDESEIGFAFAEWTSAELDEALEIARQVVRAVRAGDFWEAGRRTPQSEIFKALFGLGMLSTGPAESEEEA